MCRLHCNSKNGVSWTPPRVKPRATNFRDCYCFFYPFFLRPIISRANVRNLAGYGFVILQLNLIIVWRRIIPVRVLIGLGCEEPSWYFFIFFYFQRELLPALCFLMGVESYRHCVHVCVFFLGLKTYNKRLLPNNIILWSNWVFFIIWKNDRM